MPRSNSPRQGVRFGRVSSYHFNDVVSRGPTAIPDRNEMAAALSSVLPASEAAVGAEMTNNITSHGDGSNDTEGPQHASSMPTAPTNPMRDASVASEEAAQTQMNGGFLQWALYPLWGTIDALKWAGASVNEVAVAPVIRLASPWTWTGSIFNALKSVAPQRARDVARVAGNAMLNAVGLLRCPAGGQVLEAAGQASGSLSHALSSSAGRQLVVDSVTGLVKMAEALDTPEFKNAIQQGAVVFARGMDLLASRPAKIFLQDFTTVLTRVVELASSVEATTMAAEFTANVVHAMEVEYEAGMERSRTEKLSAPTGSVPARDIGAATGGEPGPVAEARDFARDEQESASGTRETPVTEPLKSDADTPAAKYARNDSSDLLSLDIGYPGEDDEVLGGSDKGTGNTSDDGRDGSGMVTITNVDSNTGKRWTPPPSLSGHLSATNHPDIERQGSFRRRTSMDAAAGESCRSAPSSPTGRRDSQRSASMSELFSQSSIDANDCGSTPRLRARSTSLIGRRVGRGGSKVDLLLGDEAIDSKSIDVAVTDGNGVERTRVPVQWVLNGRAKVPRFSGAKFTPVLKGKPVGLDQLLDPPGDASIEDIVRRAAVRDQTRVQLDKNANYAYGDISTNGHGSASSEGANDVATAGQERMAPGVQVEEALRNRRKETSGRNSIIFAVVLLVLAFDGLRHRVISCFATKKGVGDTNLTSHATRRGEQPPTPRPVENTASELGGEARFRAAYLPPSCRDPASGTIMNIWITPSGPCLMREEKEGRHDASGTGFEASCAASFRSCNSNPAGSSTEGNMFIDVDGGLTSTVWREGSLSSGPSDL